MPRVSAGSISGPGWGCNCPSHLKVSQYLTAMGRASEVQFKYVRTEPDGTLVFRAWTRPEDVYNVTFHPDKPGGKMCKHIMACAAHIVGPWLTTGWSKAREEQEKCQKLSRHCKALEKRLGGE